MRWSFATDPGDQIWYRVAVEPVEIEAVLGATRASFVHFPGLEVGRP